MIEVQEGLFNRSALIYNVDELLKNINNLIGNADQKNTTTFYIQNSNQSILIYDSEDWQMRSKMQIIE